MKYSACIVILFFALHADAQFIQPDIDFYHGSYQLENPLAGGFNNPQFSEVDMNLDGKKDLFIFDRSGWKILTFINTGEAGETKYKYDPSYEKRFPHLEEWALLLDFNCDGIPDLFTYNVGSTRVYKGETTGGALSFSLYKDKIFYHDDFDIPVYTVSTDICIFDDINGDGDIDVLSFTTAGSVIKYYENNSQESGWGCDSLNYDVQEFCWGLIYELNNCAGATLEVACKTNDAADAGTFRMHTGSTMLTIDKDGDGDKDLILGDVSCNNLVFYRNGGDASFAEITSKDTLFPSNTVPAYLPLFNAAYSVDFDNDGYKDLLVAPNDPTFGLNRDNTWAYHNTHPNDTISYEFVNDTLFSSQVVDAGAYSKPVFFDADNDGLQDIVIGKKNSFGKDQNTYYGLDLYKNTGSTSDPEYTFADDDYAGLASLDQPFLQPCFGDLDHDGDQDMFVGMLDGTILYLQNTAGAGAPASFASPVFYYDSIDVGYNASPALIDIDKDNKLDLVVGEQNGNLNYYHNNGTLTASHFLFQSDIWGGVDVRQPGYLTGYSAPFLYRDENDSLILLVGSQSGQIFLYDDIEESLMGEFYKDDTLVFKYNPGFFSTVSGAEINGDGRMDFITGNIRGGLNIFTEKGYVAVHDIPANYEVHIYPDPASSEIHIASDYFINGENISVAVYEVTGRKVFSRQMIIENKSLKIIVADFPAGVYFICVAQDDVKFSGSFLKE